MGSASRGGGVSEQRGWGQQAEGVGSVSGEGGLMELWRGLVTLVIGWLRDGRYVQGDAC